MLALHRPSLVPAHAAGGSGRDPVKIPVNHPYRTGGNVDDDTDRLYLSLKGAREKLCVASGLVPQHWSSDISQAIAVIDQAGSALCPAQWSRFDQPEYPTPG